MRARFGLMKLAIAATIKFGCIGAAIAESNSSGFDGTTGPGTLRTIELTPTIDAFIVNDGLGGDAIRSEDFYLNNQNLSNQQREVTAIEFSLFRLPRDVAIHNAELSVVYNGGSTPGLSLVGYVGTANGMIEGADLRNGYVLETSISEEDFNGGISGTRTGFNASNFLRLATLANAHYVGFRFDAPSLGTIFQFRSLEYPGFLDGPSLRVAYAIPEPTTVLIVIASFPVLNVRFRRVAGNYLL